MNEAYPLPNHLELLSFLTAFMAVNLPTLTMQVLHFICALFYTVCSLFYPIPSRYSIIFVNFYFGFALFIVLLYFIISQRFSF